MSLILADRNIPFAVEAFSQFGEVTLAAGREITTAMVRDVDILMVRSVTRVNESLLEGSRVRLVGTATIGTDHIDLEYLKGRGIVFADAAGSNANSVAEYVTAALLTLEGRMGTSFEGKTLGVVGVGNVGRRVVEKAHALGMKTLLNDPPRAEQEGQEGFESLDRLLTESDVVTLHTPLTKTGKHATHHLIGSRELGFMRKDAFLFNTARGAVVDNPALLQVLEGKDLSGAVLDVWENEPDPLGNLVRASRIATPHIAGYSFDGKITGTRMMAEAIGRFLAQPLVWPPEMEAPPAEPLIEVRGQGREAIREAVLRAYPIHEDDTRMRAMLNLSPADRPAYFDRLRKEYPVRREFYQYRVSGTHLSDLERKMLSGMGFQE
jgi:erythronate-4-phosphate dehydrogenase